MNNKTYAVGFYGVSRKISLIVERQIKQIREGGFPVLFQKVGALILKSFLVFVAILFVAVMRLLRPLIVVRLGSLDIARIGGVYHADWYLSGCSFQEQGKRYFDIFYITTINNNICNHQWLTMWKRVLRIVPCSKLVETVDAVSQLFPGYQAHRLPIKDVWHKALRVQKDTLKTILTYKKPHLFFTEEEQAFGQKVLRELGIPQDQPYVCFHARDSAYLDAVYPEGTWNYHDYRNSNIDNCIPAIEQLAKQGTYAVRMGSIVKEKLSVNNPSIIDYAQSGRRTDFLDIYLGAKCKFFICSQSGMSIIPEVFRLPTVYLNWSALGQIHIFAQNALIIPKKLFSREKQRLLSINEIVNSEIGLFYDGEQFEKLGIELIENTSEEISSVVNEMTQRSSGVWQEKEEDEDLQQRFWGIIGPDIVKSPEVRIGAEFLRQNRELLIK